MIEQWQELKETITELRDNDGTGSQQEVCKFLVNYMDVLEKQMQEPFDIEKYCREHFCIMVDKDVWEKAEKALEQEPKTGHWISHREHCENLGVMPSGLGAYEWCSNCDCGIDVREWHRNHYNYCPNCGARMFEPQESEEV